ncbi:MAG: alpha/beta hydrolase [Proteobacteria bacterium]|nr:alpha/beta hydrolase [Pseudomonadota bacterium]
MPDDPAVVQNRVSAEIHDMGYEKFAERTFEDMILAGLGESTRQHILARAKLLPPEIALDLNAAMADWDSTRFASALSAAAVPIAVVQSTSITGVEDWRRCKIDREPSSLWLDSWSRQPGSVNIVTVPDTGHFIMLEHPEIVVEAIRTVVKVLSA